MSRTAQAEARATAKATAEVETALRALEASRCICQECGAAFTPPPHRPGVLYPPLLCPECERGTTKSKSPA